MPEGHQPMEQFSFDRRAQKRSAQRNGALRPV